MVYLIKKSDTTKIKVRIRIYNSPNGSYYCSFILRMVPLSSRSAWTSLDKLPDSLDKLPDSLGKLPGSYREAIGKL
jgi:hypothetical protein